jgi:hypothetical protein
MGWISKRAMQTGSSLYNEGPKRKGPKRKIAKFRTYARGVFEHSTGWLECGHFSSRIYGQTHAICTKCKAGKPKDVEGDDGWPVHDD